MKLPKNISDYYKCMKEELNKLNIWKKDKKLKNSGNYGIYPEIEKKPSDSILIGITGS